MDANPGMFPIPVLVTATRYTNAHEATLQRKLVAKLAERGLPDDPNDDLDGTTCSQRAAKMEALDPDGTYRVLFSVRRFGEKLSKNEQVVGVMTSNGYIADPGSPWPPVDALQCAVEFMNGEMVPVNDIVNPAVSWTPRAARRAWEKYHQ